MFSEFPQQLINGYESFLTNRLSQEQLRYEQLGKYGQNPDTMVIGCGDSRVAPETIFKAAPGEIFVVRNIANIVPPCEFDTKHLHGTSAAIEFGVNVLKVKHIVVMGHANCGGVAAAVTEHEPYGEGDFIRKWMSQIQKPVIDKIGPAGENKAEWIKKLELGVVDYSLNNLLSFPSVKSRVDAGLLKLHGAYFGIASGVLFIKDPKTGRFNPYTQK